MNEYYKELCKTTQKANEIYSDYLNIKKLNDMKQTIEIPKGHELIKTDDNTYKIVEKKPTYPKSIKDLPQRNRYMFINEFGVIPKTYIIDNETFETIEDAEAFGALHQLRLLMHECNRIDNGGEAWERGEHAMCIYYDKRREMYHADHLLFNYPLHFKEKSTAKQFIEDHAELLEKAKILL